MAFKCQSDLIIALLTTGLILLPGIATTNVDCKGKAFHCVNSTHFKICVDFGGVSKTVDDFLIPCPPSTACTDSNYYECEYQIPTTSTPLARQSDVTNELFETSVTSPWELLDVITFFPTNNNEKSVEWLETSTTASPEIVSTAAGTETVDIVNFKVVNEVLHDVTTESDYIIHKTTASDLSESENNITSLTLTDETNNLSDHKIRANISSATVIGEDYSITESKISIDVFDTMTMPSTIEEDADFKSTHLFHSVITDSLNKNNFSAAVTTENYSDTKSEISIDQYKPFITTLPDADNKSTTLSFPFKTDDFRLNIAEEATENYVVIENNTSISMLQHVKTTPKNIEGSGDFDTTILTAPMKTDNLGLKSSLATETTEKSGTENKTLITNNKVNTHYTTTLLVPMITENLINTPNIEINLSVTSDSTSTEQYSTVSDNNSPIDTATTTNDMYTKYADVTGIDHEKETVITNNKANPHFTKTSLSAPMITEGLLNTPNIEIYLTATSDSYSTSTGQYSTESDKNSPTETATTTQEMYTNVIVTGTGTENETLITNNEVNLHFTATTLSASMITESLLSTPNNKINFPVTSDSYSTSTEQYSTVSDNNSPIETATTTNDILYTNGTVTGIGTENETMITNDKITPNRTKTSLSAPMITEGHLTTPNIEIYLTATSDSYSSSTEQYSTVSDKNSPTETATTTNAMYTNATVTGTGIENETLITNNEVNSYFTTTTVSAPMITESLINTQNIEMNLSVTSDSNSTGSEQYATVRDNNYPTETVASANQMCTNAVTKTSHSGLDDYSLNENGMNINRIDKISPSSSIQMQLLPTTTVNVVLRDTLQVSSINEQDNLSSLVGSAESLYGENVVASSHTTKFTTMADLDQTNTQTNVLYTKLQIANENIVLNRDGTSTTKLDVTINQSNLIRENIANLSTDIVNLTTKSDSSEAYVQKNMTERDKNSPTPSMRIVSDINTTVRNKTENVAFSFIGSLNDTVQELSKKGKTDLSSPGTTGSPSVTKITESYVVNTKQHTDVTKVKHPIFSTIDETIQNSPTTQNIVTGTHDRTEDEDTQNFEIQQHEKFSNFDSISTASVFLHFSEHNHNLTEPFNRLKENANDSNIMYGFSHPLNFSTSTSKSNTTNTAKHNTEHNINLTIVNVSTTSATQARVPLNDTVQNLSTLEPIINLTVTNEISSAEFQILPSTLNNVFDYITTPHSYIRDGTGVSSHLTEEEILKTTLLNENPSVSTIGTDLNPSALINDIYNSVSDDIYSSTSAKNTVTENFSLPHYVMELSTATSVIDSFYVVSTLVTSINSSSFAEANSPVIFNKSQDFKTDKTSINVNIIDKLTISTEHVLTEPVNVDLMNCSIDKDRNNIRPTFETNSNPVQLILPYYPIPKAPVKNIISSTNRTTPHKFATNMLKKPTAQLNESYLPSNNTSMGIEYKNTTKENVFRLTNIATDNTQIFATNKNPINTATLYRNENSATKSTTLKGMKVVELKQLVSKDTDKIFASDTTSDIASHTTENTLSLNPNLSKNISRQHILSANIIKDINATEEKPTARDSAMSGGFYVQGKKINSVKSKHLQNTSIITTKSPQYYTNNHNNFTKQINRVVLNTDANLYNAKVKKIKLNISENKQNLTLDSVSKSIVSFNNLSINVENLTSHDQNSSYKIGPNKTKGYINAFHFVINADNKKSSSNPVPTNEDKREVLTTKIKPVKFNNLHSDPETERTESKFNCNSRQRGKYSDKNDCQNFYICIGRYEPIFGKCPNKTVFSEISKQCTRNLSHCIRNNQFQCTSAGRYVDILSDHFYYICAKKVKGYIRYKFQCQKGYHLDKSKLKCILDTFNNSLSASELPSLDMDMDMSYEESSKTEGEKSTIERRSKEKDSKKQKNDFECKKEGNFLYPDDCRKYYQCTKTRKSKFRRKIKKCDSDEVFDNEKRKCVDEESYEC